MTRWKASLIHLTISGCIALAVLAIMLLVWYPYPLFEAVGGRQVLLILLGVDVILGPLVTLIIFNIKKSRKALSLDLSIIAILQITALLYGMSVVFQARPVFVVFSKDSFDLITANMLSDEDIAQAKNPAYRSLSLTGPVYVYSAMPTDTQERNKVVLGTFSEGKDLPQYPQYYTPFAEHQLDAAVTAKSISELKRMNPDRTGEIDKIVQDSGLTESDLGYLPLRAKYQGQAVLISKSDGRILQVLHMLP